MSDIRTLLSRNPASFDDLLDLFEAYLGTIKPYMIAAKNLVEDQIEGDKGEIYTNLMTPVDNADRMICRVQSLRTDRQAGQRVQLDLSPSDAHRVVGSSQEVLSVLYDTAAALECVHGSVRNDPDYLADQWDMPAGTLETINLAIRVLLAAAEQGGCCLARHAKTLEAAAERLSNEEEAA